MSEISKETTGILRYTKADAEELRAQIEARGIVTLVIRTELFDYARALGVMIAYTDRPGYEDIRFSGRQFDAVKMAEEIMAGVATTGEKEIARLEAEARVFVLSTEELNDD